MENLNLVGNPLGWILLLMFIVGYYFIAREEKFQIDKSKPALLVGTLMFIIIGLYLALSGSSFDIFEHQVDHLILEISEIFFFLLVAMTYVEALIERGVFLELRRKLILKGYSYHELFWITGFLAFFISPIADNLTTALILSTVLLAIDNKTKEFLVPSAINIVVAANAGGAWSPFGDITTFMAWSSNKGEFVEFLYLFPACFFGWLITAFLLSRYLSDLGKIGSEKDFQKADEGNKILKGGKTIIILGLLTIAFAVVGKQFLHLPPMWGMLFGLSILKLYMYFLKRRHGQDVSVFKVMSKVENNTLLFFFGILAAVGALHIVGFLDYVVGLYEMFNPTIVNIGVGFLSAIVDNVPVMSAIIKANPNISPDQWMLVTMTVGIGGSLISFGSAAGVAVMGKMHGIYTFSSHIRFAWVVFVGHFVSILIWYLQFVVLQIH